MLPVVASGLYTCLLTSRGLNIHGWWFAQHIVRHVVHYAVHHAFHHVAHQDEDLARQLVALGYRGSGETLKREEFEARKKAAREKNNKKQNAPKVKIGFTPRYFSGSS